MRFVNVDRTTPMLLPVDMGEWVAAKKIKSDRLLVRNVFTATQPIC